MPFRGPINAEIAAIARGCRSVSYGGGIVVANPIPHAAEIPAAEIEAALDDALRALDDAGVRGAAVTPFVLEAVGRATEGRSLPANLALAEANARLAAAIAVALAAESA